MEEMRAGAFRGFGADEDSRILSVAGSLIATRGLEPTPFLIRSTRIRAAWEPISLEGCTTDVMPGRKTSSALNSSNVANAISSGVASPQATMQRRAPKPVTPLVQNSAV